MAIVGMTVVFHLVGLIIRTTGIVHRHDEGVVDGTTHHLLTEGLRGVSLGRTNGLATLVLKGISELLGRFADGHHQHLVDLTEHTGLGLVDRGLLTLLLGHVAQLQTVFTQFRSNERTGLRRVIAGVGLRHHLGRHESVFVDQIGYATEGAAIADGRLEEELHTRIVDRLFACIDTALQHKVRLLQLIPEEEVGLRELHLNGVALFGIVGTQHIQTTEHPAAT